MAEKLTFGSVQEVIDALPPGTVIFYSEIGKLLEPQKNGLAVSNTVKGKDISAGDAARVIPVRGKFSDGYYHIKNEPFKSHYGFKLRSDALEGTGVDFELVDDKKSIRIRKEALINAEELRQLIANK